MRCTERVALGPLCRASQAHPELHRHVQAPKRIAFADQSVKACDSTVCTSCKAPNQLAVVPHSPSRPYASL